MAALSDLDARHRPASSRNREPGHRGSERIRRGVRRPRAAGGDRGEPQSAGIATVFRVIGQTNAAIARRRSPVRRNVDPGAVAMDTYAGSSAAATKLTPFTPAPQTTNSGGLRRPGGRGGSSRCQPGRRRCADGRVDSSHHRVAAAAMAGKPQHRLGRHPQRAPELTLRAHRRIYLLGPVLGDQNST